MCSFDTSPEGGWEAYFTLREVSKRAESERKSGLQGLYPRG